MANYPRISSLPLTLVVTLAACGGGNTGAPAPSAASTPPGGPATQSPAPKKISIAVPGPNQFMYLAFEVAKGHGDYAREGLDVDITKHEERDQRGRRGGLGLGDRRRSMSRSARCAWARSSSKSCRSRASRRSRSS